jgi:multimeric flavodoxin WrbA
MKDAICIVGSPRAHGSTALIVDHVIQGLVSGGVAVRRHLLGELNIGFCRGCRACDATRQCIQDDDLSLVVKDLLAADIVLVASPSYWGDVTAQLKAFIDRCAPLCEGRPGATPVPPGKVGIAVAVRSGMSPEENLHLIATIEHYFGHLGIRPLARLTVEGVRDVADAKANLTKLREAFELGASVAAEVA